MEIASIVLGLRLGVNLALGLRLGPNLALGIRLGVGSLGLSLELGSGLAL